jgi:sulfite exporter TauE/SafE
VAAALAAGLFGSAHCLGMCGGIAGALGMSARHAAGKVAPAAAYTLLFNLGRVLGYSLIGALAGFVGQGVGTGLDVPFWSALARGLTGLVMLAIGVQIATRWRLLAFIEHGGARVWTHLSHLARGLLPVRRPHQALALGMLWGWLPCGLVYSILLMALMVAEPVRSAALMAAFGLGTLPSMTAAGLASSRFNPAARPQLRRIGGLLLILFGLWTAAPPLARLIGGDGHDHGEHMAAGAAAPWTATETTKPAGSRRSAIRPVTRRPATIIAIRAAGYARANRR